jgi:hypothetical protein
MKSEMVLTHHRKPFQQIQRSGKDRIAHQRLDRLGLPR